MDSIWNIFWRVLTYIVIYSILRLIFLKVSVNGKWSQKNEEEVAIRKKGVANIFFGVAVFFTIMFVCISILPANVTGRTKLVLSGLGTLWLIFLYALSIMYSLWEIKLNDKEVLYRNYLGKVKEISYSDINCYEKYNDGSIVFKNKEKVIFKIEPEYATEVLLWISDRARITAKKMNLNGFIVRPATYHKVLGVICFFCIVVFFIFGIIVHSLSLTILSLCLAPLMIYNCVTQFTEKYTVKTDRINFDSFCRKSKSILFNEIRKVEEVYGDNVSYFFIYKKKEEKPFMKVNTYYENAQLLKQVAQKKKWMK